MKTIILLNGDLKIHQSIIVYLQSFSDSRKRRILKNLGLTKRQQSAIISYVHRDEKKQLDK